MKNDSRITPSHLNRNAYIYIRQSTEYQVRENADVALKKAGIIFGLEVSRLARNNKDWYQLLDLCSLTATLIADSDGVYDPSSFNDRLLLGLKGTMSEAELHMLKIRMLQGLYHKAGYSHKPGQNV